MNALKSSFAIKLLPSLTDFAFLMPILYLFGRMEGATALLADGDAGWHIRTGDWILANHAVPRQDIFSFSKPGEAWYAWEWLTDVIWAGLHQVGGLALVTWFSVLLIAVTFAIIFRTARVKANPVVAVAVTMAAAAASCMHWLARPHLFTFLFVALFCAALERYRSGRERVGRIPILVLLPVATVLWTNLHGGFFVGVAIIAAYGVGELLRAAFTAEKDERLRAAEQAKRYGITAAACMAASLINPYGYQLHAHILAYLRDPFLTQHINEFQPFGFTHPLAVFHELLLGLGAAAAFWNISKGRYIEPALILGLMHAAAMAWRNVPLLAVASAPYLAAAIDEWLRAAAGSRAAGRLHGALARFSRLGAETAAMESIGRWHIVSAAGALAVAALLFAPNPPQAFRAAFDARSFPERAIGRVKLDAGARVFTSDQWGDYLIYKFYPQGKVFIDGRSDFYGTQFETAVLAAQDARQGWESTLGRFGINTILLPPRAPLTRVLKECVRWRLVYDDGVALVFRKSPGQGDSAATAGGGMGRDREITKIEASDRPITRSTGPTT